MLKRDNATDHDWLRYSSDCKREWSFSLGNRKTIFDNFVPSGTVSTRLSSTILDKPEKSQS